MVAEFAEASVPVLSGEHAHASSLHFLRRDICRTFFSYRSGKMSVFSNLQSFDGRRHLQNIDSRYFTGKILLDKELAHLGWRTKVLTASVRLCCEGTARIAPVCAFCMLGQGRSSHDRRNFLWSLWKKQSGGEEAPGKRPRRTQVSPASQPGEERTRTGAAAMEMGQPLRGGGAKVGRLPRPGSSGWRE